MVKESHFAALYMDNLCQLHLKSPSTPLETKIGQAMRVAFEKCKAEGSVKDIMRGLREIPFESFDDDLGPCWIT